MTERLDVPRGTATPDEQERFERELAELLADVLERRAKMAPVGAEERGGRAA